MVELLSAERNRPLRVGLLLVSLSWFSYMLYEFTNGIINRGPLSNFWILVTDVPGCIGMASRAGAGLIAVVVVLFYVAKRDLSKPEAFMAVRLVVLFEAGYWFMSFIMSGVMGLAPLFAGSQLLGGSVAMFFENTLPCFVEAIGLAGVLVKLFLELNPNKPAKNAIKWGLIAGTFYIFVFWLNNTGNWVAALSEKGWEYITAYPANLFSFLLSTVGLLVLALYAAYFSKKSFGAESLAELDLHKVGVIVTLVGLYFGGLYVMWIFLGSVGGWGSWYAWLLGHNLDLWAMALPFVGLPLLFKRNTQEP
jgi:hypothetical protein